MSFYLKSPKGLINLHVLTECVNQRMKCYDHLADNIDIKTIDGFEYLIEDSILDRVSHFIFRLAAFSGVLPEKIFIENEIFLLKKRLECYNRSDLIYFLENIIRQLRDCIRLNLDQKLSDFYWNLFKTCIKMLDRGFLRIIFRKSNFEENSEVNYQQSKCIEVPFQYSCSFVKTRSVYLKNGFAYFEPIHWKDALSTLYSSFLKVSLKEMKYSQSVSKALQDERINNCLQILRYKYSNINFPSNSNKINLNNLEKEAVYFPLCMKNLQDSLKEKHRLAHNDRFNFSLFLKEIGLSMDDSIRFWQGEYSKEQGTCAKCTHTWKENEKKYIYSIRHLYGFEGSMKNYKMRPCSYFQGSQSITCEGVCPFVHYNDESLRCSLKKNLPLNFNDEIEVMIFDRKEDPTSSCRHYCKAALGVLNAKTLEETVSLKSNFKDPLEYFLQMKSNDLECDK